MRIEVELKSDLLAPFVKLIGLYFHIRIKNCFSYRRFTIKET